jgi:hypothetical protein
MGEAMRQRLTRFGWLRIAAAILCGQFLWCSSAVGQLPWPGYETSPNLPVPRSWVTHWYVRAEYFALWAKGNRLPELATTSPLGTPQSEAGVLGEAGTEVLLGDERIAVDGQQGGRLTFGYWLNDAKTWAAEAQYWVVGTTDGAAGNSTIFPILARPFYNNESDEQDAQLVSFPGLAGSLSIQSRNEMHSMDILARYRWINGPQGGFVDLLAGYRFFRMRETLSIDETVDVLSVEDNFIAGNTFNGIDLGAEFGLRHGPWVFDITSKVAIGNMREELDVRGRTYLTGDLSTAVAGGWLAAPSNIGHFQDDAFVVIPELDLRLVFAAYENIQLSLGYNMQFVSKVVRTGDQIDTTVSPSQLVALPLARGNAGGPAAELRPERRLNDTAMWMHGITFGCELRW